MIRCSFLKPHLASIAVATVASLSLCTTVLAAEWAPDRPVKLVVPYTPGAGADISARLFAEQLTEVLGQPVIVENRGGAGGLIGTDYGARSAADGQTLVWGSDVAFTIHPQLKKAPYDPIKDFAPVSLLVNLPMVLVTNPQKVPAHNLKELVELLKANPGKYSIASAGNGSSHHLAAEYFKHEANVELLHVPYKGAAQGLTDVLGGQADMMFVSPASVLPFIQSGKLTAIGLSVKRRLDVIPDVPTLDEAGLTDFDIGIWMGVLYPAGTPAAATDRMNTELSKILDKPSVRARIAELGYTPGGGSPDVLAKRIQDDTENYKNLIRDANIKLE